MPILQNVLNLQAQIRPLQRALLCRCFRGKKFDHHHILVEFREHRCTGKSRKGRFFAPRYLFSKIKPHSSGTTE